MHTSSYHVSYANHVRKNERVYHNHPDCRQGRKIRKKVPGSADYRQCELCQKADVALLGMNESFQKQALKYLVKRYQTSCRKSA